ncbi:MAG: hypothetical protein GTO16_10900 [Candidatus Aminicenantes bacterium]|nr:hypothetical protein [Candidatus Aminicenantes bacterium]
MKAKEIVLLILIIVVGVTFYHAHTGKIYIDFDDHIFFDHEKFVYEEFQEFNPPFPAQLHVSNAHGDIEIQGTDEERITVSFEKVIWRRNEAQAKEIADELKMIIDKDTQKLTISTNRNEFRRRNFRTSFKISVPAGIDIDVKNSYGTVKAIKVGKSHIKNRHGKIIASDIARELTIENSYKNIEVRNVQSDCKIEGKYADVFVSDVKGKTQINHRYGRIRVENISQDVKIDGYHSGIYGENLMESVDITTSYKKIALFNVGPTKIRARHSPVEVDGAKEHVDIEDNYSKVNVDNLKGDLIVNGKNLGVYGNTIVGQKIHVTSSYRNIELSEFSGKTTIFLEHGAIVLDPSPLTHPIEAIGKYADINFYWPLREKYPFEAKAKNGDIKWRLPEEISIQEEDHMSIVKAFLEEKEKPSISLSTSYRTIRIEE